MRILEKNNGFSLIELLVVLVILGLLGGLVGPRLFSQVDSSKVEVAKTQIRMLKTSLQTFRLDVGRYPSNEEGLKSLVEKPASNKLWRGPYLEELLPSDPWGNPFFYAPNANNFQGFALYSQGADGKKGGEGVNEDIGYLP